MRLRILLVAVLLCTLNAVSGQKSDTIILKSDESAERINADLDSLVNNWYVRMAYNANAGEYREDTTQKQIADSVYVERLSKINSVIQLPFNSIIKSHIQVYTVRQREKFCAVLGLMDYYFPMIENIFDSYGLPAEFKYLAIIESALNPNAVNRYSGATGMWQFMYSTGRQYGLTINSVVDERRDPIKSTHAAAKFIRDLYNIYNDWVLVIAAYDCGPGMVNKAIKRSGNKKDYWDIYYRLPVETRGYIPQYVAAAYAVTYYAEHNLNPLPVNIPVSTDTIMVHKDIHLSQISEVMGISLEELRALNPQYKTGLVPGNSKPMALTLPMNHISDFIGLHDTIRSYKKDIYLNKNTKIADPARSTYTTADVKGKTKLFYTVKDGDNLGYISGWFRVPVSDLRYWNNLYRNTIRVGQKLEIFVDPSKSEYFSKINTMTFDEKQQMLGKVAPTNLKTAVASPPEEESDGEYITYTVRYGDTIWDIVKMYDNVTTSQVLNLNNISDPEKIKIGQKLKIKKKS
jgi:membrane-bound lytic murein transglycosylase D